MEFLINSWTANPGSGLPHFISEGERFVQLLPLDTCAYTCKDGGVRANKYGTPIQIEIIHRAAEPFSDEEYHGIGKWLRDLSGVVAFDPVSLPEFYGAGAHGWTLASATSPARREVDWTRFNGVCGHQHVPGNDHWDPGYINIDKLGTCVQETRGPTSTSINTEEQELMSIKDELWTKLDWQFAALADQVEKARVGVIEANAQNAENVADVVRGEGEQGIRGVLEGLAGAGIISGDVEAAARAVAEHLTVTVKSPEPS